MLKSSKWRGAALGGSCAGACPVEAISEGADHYEINQDLCAQCGSCVDTCPTEAIIEQ